MIEVGDILQINEQDYAVIERNKKYISVFQCSREHGDLIVCLDSAEEWTFEELALIAPRTVGKITMKQLELAKRKLIHDKFEEFYDIFHQNQPFVAGELKLNYAGKVYDKNEMVALADASMDFWEPVEDLLINLKVNLRSCLVFVMHY